MKIGQAIIKTKKVYRKLFDKNSKSTSIANCLNVIEQDLANFKYLTITGSSKDHCLDQICYVAARVMRLIVLHF